MCEGKLITTSYVPVTCEKKRGLAATGVPLYGPGWRWSGGK